MEAYWKEWANLEGTGVYRWDTLTEWWRVSKEARESGEEVHLAFLFGFMVGKGSEYEPGDPRKKFKYRVVVRGNDIKNNHLRSLSSRRWQPRQLLWRLRVSVIFWGSWKETLQRVGAWSKLY